MQMMAMSINPSLSCWLRVTRNLVYLSGVHALQQPHGYGRIAATLSITGRGPRGCLHVDGRWSVLSSVATGVKQWEEVRAKRGKEVDLGELCKTTIANLDRCRVAKRSNPTKIYDHVITVEELSQAEKVLIKFRRGLSLPRPSLPMALVRACIRVGKPRKALHYITNKVQYGVFPSRRVYTVLMDSLLSNKDTRGVFGAYQQLLRDEIKPDAHVYHLLAVAHALEGGPEAVEKALELCGLCHELHLETGIEARQDVVKTLLAEGHVKEALNVLGSLEQADCLPLQTTLNLRIQALTEAGRLAEAVSLLDREVCTGELEVPQDAFPQLMAAVKERGDEETQGAMQALVRKLEAQGQLRLHSQEQNSEAPSNPPPQED